MLSRSLSVKQVYFLVALAAALLSAIYYLLKLRSECGPVPLVACAKQALGLGERGRIPERKAEEDPETKEARRAAEQHKREREEAERRVRAADERRRLVEDEKREAQKMRNFAEEKERAAEEEERAAKQYRHERKEAERRVRAADERRRLIEDEKREADRDAEEARKRARAADEDHRLSEARRVAEQALRPPHKYWRTETGGIVEYIQSGNSVSLVFVRPSTENVKFGIVPGSMIFAGVYTGTGNRVSGTKIGYMDLGCTVQVASTLIVEKDLLIEQTQDAPGACGRITIKAGRFAYTPAK